MIRLSDFLPVLALATSASLHLAAAPAHDKSQVVVPTESLVRVVVEQETSAILMGADYQARQKIQERASFDGFVLDSKAHVVLFVGEYRPSLRASKVRFTVLTHEGKAYQAQAVGLDDRISVAIVRAPIPGAVPLELASNPSFKHFNVASPGDSACPPAVACLLAGNSQDWLPFSVLKVSDWESGQSGVPSRERWLWIQRGSWSGLSPMLHPIATTTGLPTPMFYRPA